MPQNKRRPTQFANSFPRPVILGRCIRLLTITLAVLTIGHPLTAQLTLETQQITHGPQHHFFGYIGQSLTIPWNGSGRYILTLRTSFHDRMPTRNDAAEIVLIDTQNEYQVTPIEKTLAWNPQQGTMFYWHPKQNATRFFFNDRDPQTNCVFTSTVLDLSLVYVQWS